MTEITSQLMYEVLKSIQKDMAVVKASLSDHSTQFIRVREEINALRGDVLRFEGLHAQLGVRLDRIETRLNLDDNA